MDQTLLVIEIVLAVILTILILMQPKGTGFARSAASATSFTRRGVERLVFRSTFLVAFLFLAMAVVDLLV